MKIGVFDSGIGGETLVQSLQKTFPDANIMSVNDHEHLPYGDRTKQEIIRLTDACIQPLFDAKCDVIVLACNTATAHAIETLRAKYPDQKFVGIEPMIKPAAALTKSCIIAVCATPATLASERYHHLIKEYGAHLEIIEPDCSQWAWWIENNQVNRLHVEQTIDDVCDRGADVIILGCTHYHWIKDLIIELADGRAEVIEPSEAIGRRVKYLLEEQL